MKKIKPAKFSGIVPPIEIFNVVSNLFKVKIYVHMGVLKPIIFAHDFSYTDTIHIQSLSWVHFNPLLNFGYEKQNQELPKSEPHTKYFLDLDDCNDQNHIEVNVFMRNPQLITPAPGSNLCAHKIEHSVWTYFNVHDHHFCSILDSGSEVNLLSMSIFRKLNALYCYGFRDFSR